MLTMGLPRTASPTAQGIVITIVIRIALVTFILAVTWSFLEIDAESDGTMADTIALASATGRLINTRYLPE